MEIKAVKTISPNANLVLGLFDIKDLKSDELFKSLKSEDKKYVERAIERDGLNPKRVKCLHLPSNPKRIILVVGLGARKDEDT